MPNQPASTFTNVIPIDFISAQRQKELRLRSTNDAFSAHGTQCESAELRHKETRLRSMKEALSAHGYQIGASNLTIDVHKNDDSIAQIPVANFIAWPAKELKFSDSSSQIKYEFEVEGLLIENMKELPKVTINAKELTSMSWVQQKWGLDPKIYSGQKSHFFDSIHILKYKHSKTNVFQQTGWHKIDGKLHFLFPGGNISAAPSSQNVQCQLPPGKLSRYGLPETPTNPAVSSMVLRDLLDIGKPNVVYPLLSAICLPPLGEHFREIKKPLDFIEFLNGKSNCGKSSISLLGLSAYGDFDSQSYPLSFEDSPASMSPILSALKDLLCVIDDFHPVSTNGKAASDMNKLADTLGRMIGDGNVGNRFHQEAALPRTFALASGEMIPDIKSGLTRYLIVNMEASDLDYHGKFSTVMANVSLLRECTASYILWIAENWDRVSELVMKAYTTRQKDYRNLGSLRPVESVAKMGAGLEVGLTFLKEHGALNEEELQQHMALGNQTLLDILTYNLALYANPPQTELFLSGLQSIIESGKASLVPLKSKTMPTRGLGCFDDEQLYLLPSKAYDAIRQHLARHSTASLVPEKDIWRELEKDEIISWDPGRKRHTSQKRLPCMNSSNIDVLIIARKHLPDLDLSSQ